MEKKTLSQEHKEHIAESQRQAWKRRHKIASLIDEIIFSISVVVDNPSEDNLAKLQELLAEYLNWKDCTR